MYLQVKAQDGRVLYLVFAEGYRKDGKSAMRTGESLGYLDELEKQFDDPMRSLQGRLRRGQRRGEVERQNVQVTIHPCKRRQARGQHGKNAGSAVLLAVHNASVSR